MSYMKIQLESGTIIGLKIKSCLVTNKIINTKTHLKVHTIFFKHGKMEQ